MKPSRAQKIVCDSLICQISGWRDDEDIGSPNHYTSLNRDLIMELKGCCSPQIINSLVTEMAALLNLIKKVKT